MSQEKVKPKDTNPPPGPSSETEKKKKKDKEGEEDLEDFDISDIVKGAEKVSQKYKQKGGE